MRSAIRQHVLIWTAAVLFPVLGLSEGQRRTHSPDEFVCGTSPARQKEVVARARYHEARLSRLRQKGAHAVSTGVQAIQRDVGDVAVIEDDGTLVIQPNAFDLKSRSFRFEPVDSSSYRVVATTTVFNPPPSIGFRLGDDSSTTWSFSGWKFPFYGKDYDSVSINSDGNLTFNEPDVAHTARDLARFSSGPPRIGPFFTDLDPSRGGTVMALTAPDGVLIFWDGVPQYTDGTPSAFNSFGVKLFRNGNIEFSYGSRVDSRDAIVGISPGSYQGNIQAVDYETALPTGPLDGTLVEIFSSTLSLSEAAVAQKFFESHADHFDHLTLFLGFDYDLGGGAYAYELNVKNEIDGIGLEVFDDSATFGSKGRLRSFLNMGTLTRYPSDPNLVYLGTNSTMGIMGQESGHRWLAFTPFRDGLANSTEDLGRDLAHWSFFFNSEGSVMEGNKIEDRGVDQGITRFRTVEATDTYSTLDRYIIGLIGGEDVPPSFLVANPTGTPLQPASAPRLGVTFGGTRQDITIDSIVAANGPRVPSFHEAPKVFRQGFIYLVPRGQTAAPEQIQKVQTIRDAWVRFFNEQTGKNGWIVTDLQDKPGTTASSIFFPFFQGNANRYTGIAVANWGSTPADVLFTAYLTLDGTTQTDPSNIINPSMITIPPKAQVAMLAEQIHGLSLTDPHNGWIRADSTNSQVTGFFLDGDVSQTLLAGAVADGNSYTSLYFMRAQVASAPSPGNDYRNLMSIVNPSTTSAIFNVTLHDEFGNAQGSILYGLVPQGRMALDLPTLFPIVAQPNLIRYVSIASDQGIIGYQSIDTGSTIFALPAVSPTDATTLYSAHFASGNAGGIQYFSDLNFINTSGQSRKMQVLLINNSGHPVGGIQNPVTVDLAAGQQLHRRGESFFGLPDASIATSYIDGSLVVTADGPGIIGDVTFGDAVAGQFLASLSLDGKPSSNFIFSQVAQGSAGSTKPMWTGIAMYNPGATDISVTLDVYSKAGNKTGSTTFPLAKGNRLSQTLPQYVSAVPEQMGGYIRVSTSGGPIVAFELFGGTTLDFLTAVPPQPITP